MGKLNGCNLLPLVHLDVCEARVCLGLHGNQSHTFSEAEAHQSFGFVVNV